MNSRDYIVLEDLYGAHNYHPLDAVLTKGKGIWVWDVEGQIGIDLKPEAGGARRFCEELKTEGLLCKETHENVLRFAPPLIIRSKDLNWALKRVKRVFKRLS